MNLGVQPAPHKGVPGTKSGAVCREDGYRLGPLAARTSCFRLESKQPGFAATPRGLARAVWVKISVRQNFFILI